MVKISDVARRVAEKDGQEWESLPDLMKMEYHMQVERVFQAASELGDEWNATMARAIELGSKKYD